MTDKPAAETMTNQERFNAAVMGWISEATEAIEACDAMSDSAKRYVDEMRCQCGDAYQALFRQPIASLRPTLTDEEREAIEAAVRIIDAYDDEMDGFPSGAADTLRSLLERTK